MARARTAAVGVLVLLAPFLAVEVMAMALYPGGTWMDRTPLWHRFWENFICELGHEVAADGRPNPAAPWGRAALWLLVLGTGAFWLAVPTLFRTQGWARFVRASGTLSTAGLLLLPFATGPWHLGVVVCGALPGLASAFATLWALRHRRGLAALGLLAAALALADLVLYVRYFSDPISAVPLVQRLALLASLTWMASCALAVLRQVDPTTAAAVPTGSAWRYRFPVGWLRRR
jgi:hypothetical protein